MLQIVFEQWGEMAWHGMEPNVTVCYCSLSESDLSAMQKTTTVHTLP